jgi:xylulokinase
MIYVIAYDFGTTGVKTCLFEIGDKVKLLVGCYASYGLYILENGGAEQDADEWWDAMCRTTKEVFTKTDIRPEQIAGISFCSQMQGLVLVDRERESPAPPDELHGPESGTGNEADAGKGASPFPASAQKSCCAA